ncbi:MAG: magnesium transporter [Lentisphaerae bacterium]|jgi:magnesium transporter|nr:magnesium transporter [Lentisphaerota bacterium]
MEEYKNELEQLAVLGELSERLSKMNPVDAANELAEWEDKDKLLLVFRLLGKDQAAAIFTYLDKDLHRYLVEGISNIEMNELFRRLALDDAVDIIEELPANMVNMILSSTSPEKRSAINRALQYPEYSAGSLMTVEYISLFESMTAGGAIEHIRKIGLDKETIYSCYVTGPTRKLVGAVSLRRLILAENDETVGDLMTKEVVYAHTLEDQEEVARKFQEYDLNAMPVVDNENRIVGIITIDDIVDVIEAENTEDFEKMAALHPSDDEYLKTSIVKLARNRIVWLLLLMISATFTGGIIGYYQGLLDSAVVLAAFIPMLMDTGGNCGSQASTLIIRGMAVGEIELSSWYRVLWKEFRVGVLVAVALTSVNYLRMRFFNSLTYGEATPKDRVELVVTLTLFLTVVLAKLIGCALPLLAKKLKTDPALMAAPMLTTIVDALSLAIYFSIAAALLSL